MGRPRKTPNTPLQSVSPPDVSQAFIPQPGVLSAPVPLEFSQEEIQAIFELRKAKTESLLNSTPGGAQNMAIGELAQALITAIESTRPPTKKTPFTRKKGSPWDPPDGSPKPKLKRVMMQHGMEINPDQVSSEEIELLNKIKPGRYCGGHIQVTRRKDRSYDIDYPIRTASQRLKLSNKFGITSLTSLLQRLIDEAADPAKYKGPDDDLDD